MALVVLTWIKASNVIPVFELSHYVGYTMTTWTIKTVTDDPQSVQAMVEDQRNRGYEVWIEDEIGRTVDEEPLKKSGRSLYQMVMAVIIWGAAIAVTLGALYVANILSGDPLRL